MRITRTSRVFAVAMLLGAALAGQKAMGYQTVVQSGYIISEPVLNMYKTPSLDEAVISSALYGHAVTVQERKRGWVKIQTADGYTGWVLARGLAKPASEYAPQAVQIASLSANVYREPDTTKHAPLLRLPFESRLEVVSRKVASDDEGRWIQVLLVDGRKAYVQAGDVSSDAPHMSIDQTIEFARRFLGITYTWGGVSSFGYDCSGFTQMLMRQRGIFMPRDADQQANWSGVVAVERKDLRAGDLLYFGKNIDKISHTGMYIGGGEFIHDTPHGHPGVQISRLDDDPWTKILVAARRVKP